MRWVTLPQSRRVAAPNNFKIIYGQGGFYSLGVKTIKIKKATIKVYDPEKALIQVFKYGDFETGLAALKNYLKSDRANLKKLSQYGKILRHSLDDRVRSLLVQ